MTGFNDMGGSSPWNGKAERHSTTSSPSMADFAEPQMRQRDLKVSFANEYTPAGAASRLSGPVRLNLGQLRPFEIVERQFQSHGVTFKNAIALIPSNPAYPARHGQTVLMGCPKSGWMEATFERPVEFVAGCITASSSAVMQAYDADDRPLAKARIPQANLAGSGSHIPPNTELSLRSRNIRRVTFQSFDGQLTLGEFCFG